MEMSKMNWIELNWYAHWIHTAGMLTQADQEMQDKITFECKHKSQKSHSKRATAIICVQLSATKI